MANRCRGLVRFAVAAALALSGCNCGEEPTGKADGSGVAGKDAGPARQDTGAVCIPTNCQQLQAQCGVVDDGCGTQLECGTCDAGTCGGGGTPHQCGWTAPDTGAVEGPDAEAVEPPDAEGVEPLDAAAAVDGGPDAAAPGPDAGVECVPKTSCGLMGFNCGAVADGCGALTECGACGTGGVCGGSEPNVCASFTTCVRKTCQD